MLSKDQIISQPFIFERPKDISNHSGNRAHSLRFQGEVFEAGKVDVSTEGILEVSSGREKCWRAASATSFRRGLAGCGKAVVACENFDGSHVCLRRAQSSGTIEKHSRRMLKKAVLVVRET
jgi:hypothetical protein